MWASALPACSWNEVSERIEATDLELGAALMLHHQVTALVS